MKILGCRHGGMVDGWMDGWIKFLTSIVDTVNTKAKQYQECDTLITRIEVRIMRLRKEKGDRIKGALQATRDPDVPNNCWLVLR